MKDKKNLMPLPRQTIMLFNPDRQPLQNRGRRILIALLSSFILLLCFSILIFLAVIITGGGPDTKQDETSNEEAPQADPEPETKKDEIPLLPSAPAAGQLYSLKLDGTEFVFHWCPAGEFTMGSPKEESKRESERPHKVTFSQGFWLLETEVTQEMWKKVMDNNPSEFKNDQNPVESVSWDDCQTFCQKLTGKIQEKLAEQKQDPPVEFPPIQLPTEAQWEYACRAGTTGAHAGDLGQMAWFNDNSGAHPHEVRNTKPNAWGLFDMHGNVFEWCKDWYDPNYYNNSPASDPENTTAAEARVYRGGGWRSNANDCSSAYRCWNPQNLAENNRGLRVLFVPDNVKTDEKVELPKGPAAGTRKVWQVDGVEYAFRWCPPGEFMMGSPDDEQGRRADEAQHNVTISQGFWLLETEVTQHMWKSIMGKNPSYHHGLGWWGITKNYDADNYPVECVNWYECQEFCRKLSAKLGEKVDLPSEAQWEYACRAGSTGAYAGDVNSMAWYKGNYDKDRDTSEVGKKKPNSWGLYDMLGNVSEWCSDWYDEKYTPEKTKNPQKRVTRGGAWDKPSTDCRSAIRDSTPPDNRFYSLGLRVLIVPSQAE